MKKANKKSRIGDLAIDVAEYAFTEWLVRRGVFAAFKANLDFTNSSRESFRDQLRIHIQIALTCSGLGFSSLVSSAFPFIRTPEGAKFWKEQSDAWRRFCAKFQMQF